MLASLRNMVRVADLRNKILFTVMVIAIYQLGISVPVPGVDFNKILSINPSRTSPRRSSSSS